MGIPRIATSSEPFCENYTQQSISQPSPVAAYKKSSTVKIYSENVIREEGSTDTVDRDSIANLDSTRQQWERIHKHVQPETVSPNRKCPVRHWSVKIPRFEKVPPPHCETISMEDEDDQTESVIAREIRLTREREEKIKLEHRKAESEIYQKQSSYNSLLKIQVSSDSFPEYKAKTPQPHSISAISQKNDDALNNVNTCDRYPKPKNNVASILQPEEKNIAFGDTPDKTTKENLQRTSQNHQDDNNNFNKFDKGMDRGNMNLNLASNKVSPIYLYEKENLIEKELREMELREYELNKQRGSHFQNTNLNVRNQTSPKTVKPQQKWQNKSSPCLTKETKPISVETTESRSSGIHTDFTSNNTIAAPEYTLSRSSEECEATNETPIERDIRLSREREKEYRQNKQLPDFDTKTLSLNAKQNQATSVHSSYGDSYIGKCTKSSADNHLSPSQIHDMLDGKPREEALQSDRKLLITSQDRIITQGFKIENTKNGKGYQLPRKTSLIKLISNNTSADKPTNTQNVPIPPPPPPPPSAIPRKISGDTQAFSYKEIHQKAESLIEKEMQDITQREIELREQRNRNATYYGGLSKSGKTGKRW